MDLIVATDGASAAAATAQQSSLSPDALDELSASLRPKDRVGVLRYGRRVEQRRTLAVPSGDMGSSLRSRSLGRRVEGPADLVSAVQEGANLLAASASEQRKQAILVVSGSPVAERSNQAVERLSESVRRLGLDVHIFRLDASGSSSTLDRLVQGTGAVLYPVEDSQRLISLMSSLVGTLRGEGKAVLSDGVLNVDSGLKRAQISIRGGQEGADSETVLISPSGRRIRPGEDAPGVRWKRTETGLDLVLEQPAPGAWRLETAAGQVVEAGLEASKILILEARQKKLGEPRVVVSARLVDEEGATLRDAQLPLGLALTLRLVGAATGRSVTLMDDGGEADNKASDGVFGGAIVAPEGSSRVELRVRARGRGFDRSRTVELGLRGISQRAPAAASGVVEPSSGFEWKGLLPLVLGGLGLLTLLFGRRRLLAQRAAGGGGDQVGLGSSPAAGAGGSRARPGDLSQAEIDELVASHRRELGLPAAPEDGEQPDLSGTLLVIEAATSELGDQMAAALPGVTIVSLSREQLETQGAPPESVAVIMVKSEREQSAEAQGWPQQGQISVSPLRVLQRADEEEVQEELASGAVDVALQDVAPGQLFKRAVRAARTSATPLRVAALSSRSGPFFHHRTDRDLKMLRQRLRQIPVLLQVKQGSTVQGEVVLVDMSARGFAALATHSPSEGIVYAFEADLFDSLSLGLVAGEVERYAGLRIAGFPYLWEVLFVGLDDSTVQRVLSCYEGIVRT